MPGDRRRDAPAVRMAKDAASSPTAARTALERADEALEGVRLAAAHQRGRAKAASAPRSGAASNVAPAAASIGGHSGVPRRLRRVLGAPSLA